VFISPEGGTLNHKNFYRRHFKPAVTAAALSPKTRFHDLRHTCAALCIELGAHPKAIQERLGHSSITVTLTATATCSRSWMRRSPTGSTMPVSVTWWRSSSPAAPTSSPVSAVG